MKPVFDKLPFRFIQGIKQAEERVLFFNPAEIYSSHPVNAFSRAQQHLSFPLLFPQVKQGMCACGCGKTLSGKQRRWASAECTEFALNVWRIIDGQVDTVKYFVNLYNKGTRRCGRCGKGRMKFEIDHVVPVHSGGGGCWLNNYQRLCKTCHRQKTNEDLVSRKKRKGNAILLMEKKQAA
jgi:5-methylcytosine-specific restriction endonuclease McrA